MIGAVTGVVGGAVTGTVAGAAAPVAAAARTVTMPSNKLYGHPSGRSVGTGGKSRIDCRISPSSTNPSCSRGCFADAVVGAQASHLAAKVLVDDLHLGELIGALRNLLILVEQRLDREHEDRRRQRRRDRHRCHRQQHVGATRPRDAAVDLDRPAQVAEPRAASIGGARGRRRAIECGRGLPAHWCTLAVVVVFESLLGAPVSASPVFDDSLAALAHAGASLAVRPAAMTSIDLRLLRGLGW